MIQQICLLIVLKEFMLSKWLSYFLFHNSVGNDINHTFIMDNIFSIIELDYIDCIYKAKATFMICSTTY